MNKKLLEKAKAVYEALALAHPDAHCELNYSNPLELLIATILSAQCTDVRVNQVTAVLFKKCPTLKQYLALSQEELEEIIRSTGFYRNKAKNILEAVQAIQIKHGGEVPQSMEELSALAGVGRKTANVVLGNAFNLPGLPVDTHVKRLCQRLGLSKSEDPVKIEHELMKLLPPDKWCQFSHYLIFHGRRVCKARSPLCEQCSMRKLCPSAK